MIPSTDLLATLRGLLEQIPPGRVTTFGDLAEALGDLRAARWVAQAITKLTDRPVHRVVKRTGKIVLSDPARAAVQWQRLADEGILCTPEGTLTLQDHRWTNFRCDAPLKQLAEWQERVALQASHRADVEVPRVMAGLDVSYASETEAVAAYVEVDVDTQALLFSATHRAPVSFPYITGYLTFRELPMHLALLDRVRQQKPLAKVILVDGAGQLHPRRAGIAVAVGVAADCVTIGVAKHHLLGRTVSTEAEPLLEDRGEILGQMVFAANGKHPAYVSPGHQISLASAVQCVRAVWPSGRSPSPIWLADQLSRRIARQ